VVIDSMHLDFIELKKHVYQRYGWECKNVIKDRESHKYGACSFDINNHHIIFRVGNITPTKVGQFVTLWKRIGTGPILPYDLTDAVDFFLIMVRSDNNFGIFVFPKSVLYEKGIISKDGKGGKRAMRIYPTWDVANNPQAKKSQAWQLHYFYEINNFDDSSLYNIFKNYQLIR